VKKLSRVQRKETLFKKTLKDYKKLQDLEKLTSSLYEDNKNALVFLISQKYDSAWYWLGFGESHKDFLEKKRKKGHVLLGCDYPGTRSIVIPYIDFKKLLKKMSKTKKDSGQWQIKLYNNGTDAFLKLLHNEMIDISKFLV